MSHKVVKLAYWLVPILFLSLCPLALVAQYGNAQQEKKPATAKAMTALANDYTALVESRSGAAQLPDMSTVQSDGAAFDKACSNS